MLKIYLNKNYLVYLNAKLHKRLHQIWTFTAPNKSKSHIGYWKWENSAIICRAYSSFTSAQSDHCIVSAKLGLTLHVNDSKSSSRVPCDWSSLGKKPQI